MFECFYPDEYLDSIESIEFQKLYEQGLRGVLFDIDNTLVPHGAPADAHALRFFEKLRKIGIRYCLISNNQLPRVKPFADAVGAEFVENAHKPSPKNYEKGMEMLGCTKENAMFVGDQLFTDILGANRLGIQTVLVKPINSKEEIQIVLKRYLEKPVLYCYRKSLKKG